MSKTTAKMKYLRLLFSSSPLFVLTMWLQVFNGILLASCANGIPIPSSGHNVNRLIHVAQPNDKDNTPHLSSFGVMEESLRPRSYDGSSSHSIEDFDYRSGSQEERLHQFQKLFPTDLYLSRQFSKYDSPVVNQANGPFLPENKALADAETNSRLGLYNTDYDSSKHIAARAESTGVGPVGAPGGKRAHSSVSSAREGYMCHFKLCQFGTSGKRRWSPVFEFD